MEDKRGTTELVRSSSEQQNAAPVVPAPPPSEAASVTLTAGVSPSTAHLTTGLRSSNNESNLNITSQSLQASGTTTKTEPTSSMSHQGPWIGNTLTWEQARDRLRKAGVTWLRAELQDGIWRLQCSVPNPQFPEKIRFYEAEGNNELVAMRAMVEKIEQAQ